MGFEDFFWKVFYFDEKGVWIKTLNERERFF